MHWAGFFFINFVYKRHISFSEFQQLPLSKIAFYPFFHPRFLSSNVGALRIKLTYYLESQEIGHPLDCDLSSFGVGRNLFLFFFLHSMMRLWSSRKPSGAAREEAGSYHETGPLLGSL